MTSAQLRNEFRNSMAPPLEEALHNFIDDKLKEVWDRTEKFMGDVVSRPFDQMKNSKEPYAGFVPLLVIPPNNIDGAGDTWYDCSD